MTIMRACDSSLFFLTTLALAGDFTTSLGDTYPYTISAITTDSAGNTYVVGSRQIGFLTGAIAISVIFDPVVFSPSGSDVFVSKLDPNGQLLFTDAFGGKGVDQGLAIALDPSGSIYIAGSTTSPDFPLSKALQTQPNTTGTGFIVKLSNDGTTILYSTYFGGTLGGTSISSLATDAKGNLYLTGWTNAPDFPHTPGLPFGPFPTPAPPSPLAQPAPSPARSSPRSPPRATRFYTREPSSAPPRASQIRARSAPSAPPAHPSPSTPPATPTLPGTPPSICRPPQASFRRTASERSSPRSTLPALASVISLT